MTESYLRADEILERCLVRVRGGESVEDCLRDYPALAHELEPMLAVARQARGLEIPQLSAAARSRVRKQLRHSVAQQARRSAPTGWFGTPILRFVLACMATLFAMGGGLVAAQTSLPTSPLYVVKRASEDARLRLARGPADRAALYLQYSETRFSEIVALASAGQVVPESLVADCAHQGDLAMSAIEQLDTSAAGPLYQRYVATVEARVDRLTDTMVALSVSNRATLQSLEQHQRGALAQARANPPPGWERAPERPTKETPRPTATPPASADQPAQRPADPGSNGGGNGGNSGGNGGQPADPAQPADPGSNGGGNSGGNGGNSGGNGGQPADPAQPVDPGSNGGGNSGGNGGNSGGNGGQPADPAQPADPGGNGGGNGGNGGGNGGQPAQPGQPADPGSNGGGNGAQPATTDVPAQPADPGQAPNQSNGQSGDGSSNNGGGNGGQPNTDEKQGGKP